MLANKNKADGICILSTLFFENILIILPKCDTSNGIESKRSRWLLPANREGGETLGAHTIPERDNTASV